MRGFFSISVRWSLRWILIAAAVLAICSQILFRLIVLSESQTATSMCGHHLTECGTALRRYAEKHGGRYPEARDWTKVVSDSGNEPSGGCLGRNTYDYHQPPRNAHDDFVVLSCRRRHTVAELVLARPVRLELLLNGTVRCQRL